MLLLIRTLAKKQIILILLDFYVVLVSPESRDQYLIRLRFPVAEGDLAHVRQRFRCRLMIKCSLLYEQLSWLSRNAEAAFFQLLSLGVPVTRCNLSSQIVSGCWRLMYRLASSCTVQLVTSFTKTWTFLIFLGQAFQT